MTRAQEMIAVAGGLGRLPGAPGTWASIAAIPVAWGLHALGGFPLVALATLAAFAAGLWATGAYLAATGTDDPGEVVVDEVVGMWLALWPLSFGLWLRDLPGEVFPWPGWVLGFLLFRAFDIAKPPPIRRIERVGGAWGVMLDDVVAGVMAAVLGAAAAVVAHGALM